MDDSYLSIYKWKISLDKFGLLTFEQIDILRHCGIEIVYGESVGYFSLFVKSNVYPELKLKSNFRKTLSNHIQNFVKSINPSEFLLKIAKVLADHVESNDPIDLTINTGGNYPIDYDTTFLSASFEDVLMRIRIFDFILKYGTDHILQGSRIPDINPETDQKSSVYFGHNVIPKIDTPLRKEEKIVTYKDTNWKVIYEIYFTRDEKYSHIIEIIDFNDEQNSSKITIQTDSRYIKDLNGILKEEIENLEKNLWTIERFKKWDGVLF